MSAIVKLSSGIEELKKDVRKMPILQDFSWKIVILRGINEQLELQQRSCCATRLLVPCYSKAHRVIKTRKVVNTYIPCDVDDVT